MGQPLKLDAIEDLPRAPASDVKKLGWRGVMKAVGSRGKLVVTNHDEPQAVILSTQEYDAILHALQEAGAQHDSALERLRLSFDERLAALQADDAGTRLRGLMRGPARLGGKIRAGGGR